MDRGLAVVNLCVALDVIGQVVHPATGLEGRYSAVLKGKCPKCGTRYFGWAMRDPRQRTCNKCGVELEVTDNNKTPHRIKKTKKG